MLATTVVQGSDWKVVAVHGALSLIGAIVTAWLSGQKRRERQEQLDFRRAMLALKPSRVTRRKTARRAVPASKTTKNKP